MDKAFAIENARERERLTLCGITDRHENMSCLVRYLKKEGSKSNAHFNPFE
jgi:hypothetical protein